MPRQTTKSQTHDAPPVAGGSGKEEPPARWSTADQAQRREVLHLRHCQVCDESTTDRCRTGTHLATVTDAAFIAAIGDRPEAVAGGSLHRILQVKSDGWYRLDEHDGPVPLELMQELVDGHVERVASPSYDVYLNEEGRLRPEFEVNVGASWLLHEAGVRGQTLVGPAFFLSHATGEEVYPLEFSILEVALEILHRLGWEDEGEEDPPPPVSGVRGPRFTSLPLAGWVWSCLHPDCLWKRRRSPSVAVASEEAQRHADQCEHRRVQQRPPIAGGCDIDEPIYHDYRVTVRENMTEDRDWVLNATDEEDARTRYTEGEDVDSRTIEIHSTSVRSVEHETQYCDGCYEEQRRGGVRPPIGGGSIAAGCIGRERCIAATHGHCDDHEHEVHGLELGCTGAICYCGPSTPATEEAYEARLAHWYEERPLVPIAGGSGQVGAEPLPFVAPTDSEDEGPAEHHFTVFAIERYESERRWLVTAPDEHAIHAGADTAHYEECFKNYGEAFISRRVSEVYHDDDCPACEELTPIGGGAIRTPKLSWKKSGGRGDITYTSGKYVLFHPFTEAFEKHGKGGLRISPRWRVLFEDRHYTRSEGWTGPSETLGTYDTLHEAKRCAQRHADDAYMRDRPDDEEEQLALKPIAGGSGEEEPLFASCWPVAEYFAALPDTAWDQKNGNYWIKPEDFRPCCVGAHLAYFLGTEIYGEEELSKRLNLTPSQLRNLLHAAGASHNPFSAVRWPIPPAAVFANLLSIEEVPTQRESWFMHADAVAAYRVKTRPIAGGSGEVDPHWHGYDGVCFLDPEDAQRAATLHLVSQPCTNRDCADTIERTKAAMKEAKNDPDTYQETCVVCGHCGNVKRRSARWACIVCNTIQPTGPAADGSWGSSAPETKPLRPPGRLTTRQRRTNRMNRREEWADSRARKKAQAFDEFKQRMKELPPMGEPIKVGHHSERGHRRAIARVDRALEKYGEHDQMLGKHERAADAIAHELEVSIYDDDHDAVAQLQARIAAFEARRSRMKAVNQWLAKHGAIPRRRVPRGSPDALYERARDALQRCREALSLTDDEAKDLVNALLYSETLGYPPYALSNLGGNIRRQGKRLERLQQEAASLQEESL